MYNAAPGEPPLPLTAVGATLYTMSRGKMTLIEAIREGRRETIYTRAGESDCYEANSHGVVLCEEGTLAHVSFATKERRTLWSYAVHSSVSLSDDGGIAWETDKTIHVRRPKCL